MNPSFKKCLENKKIVPNPSAKRLVTKELETAKADLKEAQESFEKGAYKWGTIQSYYAMFHGARALLYNKGYKERSHFCLAVALEALYVDTKLLPVKFSNAFRKAMSLREDADYSVEFSKEGANIVITSAGDFLEEVEKIVKTTSKRELGDKGFILNL